ncbi:MAG: Ig-like domain-containing protein [Bacteroidales bacterium]|jgi:uncharacterized protein (DUF2141 family)|nr:Ig-like domain-containing protein [Bacteroidales bacterium]
MIRHILHLLLGIFAIWALADCASMRAPTGGPKDIYPPVVIESEPPNYTTNFDADKIVLRFDEFVAVSDVTQEVFISPPFQRTPDMKTRGKSVIINIDEELLDSTTYSIFFGNSIKDITENNPIENYNFVFSTGDRIDSLSVIGEVIDAFNLKPREDVLVMLYEDRNDTIIFDSLPYLVKPSYLTRTNASGFFVINNLRMGKYMMFALNDINLSATYDGGEEEIGFLDSLISPEYLVSETLDSALVDSLGAELDSLYMQIPDSVLFADTLAADGTDDSMFSLYLFKETPDTVQKLLEASKPRRQVLKFIFRYPADDVNITPLTPVPNEWMLEEWSKTRDTLRYYILSAALDTISLRIWQDTSVYDTVSWSLVEDEIPQRKKDEEEGQVLGFISNISNPFAFYDTLVIRTAYPISSVDFNRFLLTEGDDTVKSDYEIFDPAGRMIRMNYALKQQTGYRLFFPDSVLTDIIGRSNDTTEFSFNTNSEEDFGLYVLHAVNSSPYERLVVQLMTESEVILKENRVTSEESIRWESLVPGKYIIKAFADLNHNGKWDTGDFLKKRQPEPVVYFSEVIEIRAGWSFEGDWHIEFK